MSTTEPTASTRLWDGPTRLFHWSMAILIVVAWLTAGKQMEVHRLSGYAVIGLLVFRLWWGVAGGSTARFASFLKGPGATVAYLKTLRSREPGETAGHNPLGAWSVVAMLVVMAVQAGLGLFAVDIDGIESGPFSDLVDFDTGRAFAEGHELSFRALQGLIGLHLLAIAYYRFWKGENLVGAMVTGRRVFATAVEPLKAAPLWRLVVGAVVAAAFAYAVAKGFHFKFK
ncbi:cytochrome b/b6 domain-containing protein [Phenylobacterium aquaticum]|uniref:cytochrome b/b6 domain-containing protein n=1 Tax=Phenylobacterium aquaticum TaxID=1763816 RepID=UPI0026F19F9E|nr:cytochrome b/b6 domain-containing protein [Phenylobacterium aquaticum]